MGGIQGCQTMAPNDPNSLPRNIHSENPSCFDTSSLMLDQSKGKNRAWSPTVALASGRFHQKLGECLHPGSGAGCCISLFCSGFWVPPAPCCTSRPCAACSAPLPCCWAGQRHPRTPVWAPCLPGLALPVPWCDTSLRCSRLPAPLSGLLAAGGRPHPSPRAESQQWGCDVPRTCLGQHRGCRVLPARFRDLRHGFGLIQSWAMGERGRGRGCVLGKEMRRWQRARRPLGRGGATRREHPRIRTQGRRREPGTGSLGWPIPAIQLSRSAAPRTPRARRCRPGCPGSDPSAAQPAAPVRRRPPTARRGAAFASPSRGVVPADGPPYPPGIP